MSMTATLTGAYVIPRDNEVHEEIARCLRTSAHQEVSRALLCGEVHEAVIN
ncbi:hypothetical protein Clacol_000315 [Clathrus columnatus]|uniref:Uncharacterized protein n=1 Tax=Clathrus columnatus TaxID=1419009 RepID=A0AAV5A0M3_9AGAM|nr:hypothetical protein Clacol_000315 [Clathrus columnatus]